MLIIKAQPHQKIIAAYLGKNIVDLTFRFKSWTSFLSFHDGKRLVNSIGSCPAQTSRVSGFGEASRYFRSRNSSTVSMATRRSACHRIRPEPVLRFVSPVSWPASGHQPCHSQRHSPPASSKKRAENKKRQWDKLLVKAEEPQIWNRLIIGLLWNT